jgi:hypothetical protein
MAANYVLLEKITVGAAGATSVTFSSIPQTGYTDILIKGSMRDSGASNNFTVEFNGNSSSVYTQKTLFAENTTSNSVSRGPRANFYYDAIDDNTHTASTFNSFEMYISNYTSSSNKSVSTESVSENNTVAKGIRNISADLFSSTAAITSIKLTQTFAQYSTFYLYGVAKLGTTPAIVPYATGGDTIMTDGTYWYHAFTSSGTFTPASGKSLSCDVIVVAGGGGGGSSLGGGGGAGGLLAYSAQSVPTARTITVGAGGAGGLTASATPGTDGSNSSISSLTAATGGGGGGSDGTRTGRNGGSGGGGAGNAGASGGTATSGQGSNGGAAAAAVYALGGGGGKGSAGTAGVVNQSGAGGAGVNTYSSWLSATGLGVSGFIAGGGGGGGFEALSYQPGAGGSGGGGAGASIAGSNNNTPGNPGTANTGGGAGGGLEAGNGGAGGSGLVIVRYAV